MSRDVAKLSSAEPAVPVTRRGVFRITRVRVAERGGSSARMRLGRQLLLQAILLFISFTVLFPLLWVVSMSIDPRNISRPSELTLIPPGASLQAYADVVARPTSNPVTLPQLAFNSFLLAAGTSLGSLIVGVFAAYAFSRFRFPGRPFLMIAIVAVLMVPTVAALAPLFVLLNKVQISMGDFNFNLRNSLVGVGLALISGALPFAIWNLKGYIDTIPKELEEAATIDGCSTNQTFFHIMLPLATPALAVTAFLGFLTGWTEFVMSWQFLTNPDNFTLAMALWGMTGQYADNTPWSKFSAMAIIVALPVSVVYLSLQKYIVGGLTIGGVKG
jgi:arabinogalactan oligomer/maltooligosaccharide transport system permease protein